MTETILVVGASGKFAGMMVPESNRPKARDSGNPFEVSVDRRQF